ncbi:MAG: FAD-dependent oxidoreductase [Dongiaceae bacterium]
MARTFDVAIIGGGINGCGIARGRVRAPVVYLCEQRPDLARKAARLSLASSSGGLRYLEYYEFRLVREALQEHQCCGAQHRIVWPLRFVLPHHRGLRPAWLLRLGLFLYDHLGGASCCRRRAHP